MKTIYFTSRSKIVFIVMASGKEHFILAIFVLSILER